MKTAHWIITDCRKNRTRTHLYHVIKKNVIKATCEKQNLESLSLIHAIFL
jgi:hypothetical protein